MKIRVCVPFYKDFDRTVILADTYHSETSVNGSSIYTLFYVETSPNNAYYMLSANSRTSITVDATVSHETSYGGNGVIRVDTTLSKVETTDFVNDTYGELQGGGTWMSRVDSITTTTHEIYHNDKLVLSFKAFSTGHSLEESKTYTPDHAAISASDLYESYSKSLISIVCGDKDTLTYDGTLTIVWSESEVNSTNDLDSNYEYNRNVTEYTRVISLADGTDCETSNTSKNP